MQKTLDDLVDFIGLQKDGETYIPLYNCKECKSTIIGVYKHYISYHPNKLKEPEALKRS